MAARDAWGASDYKQYRIVTPRPVDRRDVVTLNASCDRFAVGAKVGDGGCVVVFIQKFAPARVGVIKGKKGGK